MRPGAPPLRARLARGFDFRRSRRPHVADRLERQLPCGLRFVLRVRHAGELYTATANLRNLRLGPTGETELPLHCGHKTALRGIS